MTRLSVFPSLLFATRQEGSEDQATQAWLRACSLSSWNLYSLMTHPTLLSQSFCRKIILQVEYEETKARFDTLCEKASQIYKVRKVGVECCLSLSLSLSVCLSVSLSLSLSFASCSQAPSTKPPSTKGPAHLKDIETCTVQYSLSMTCLWSAFCVLHVKRCTKSVQNSECPLDLLCFGAMPAAGEFHLRVFSWIFNLFMQTSLTYVEYCITR